MNAQKRKRLSTLHDELISIQTTIDSLKADEEDAFDNLPPNIQDCPRGEKFQEAITKLEEVSESLALAMDALGEMIE